MNNKGFAITSIIYGLMLLFVMVVASFLSVLVGRNRRMDDLLDGVRDTLDYPVNVVRYDEASNYFYIDKDGNNSFNNIIDDDSDGKLDEGSEALNINLGVFITNDRGIYDFSAIMAGCTKYLPKNIVIVNAKYFDSESYTETMLFYNTTGGDFSTENYTELCS